MSARRLTALLVLGIAAGAAAALAGRPGEKPAKPALMKHDHGMIQIADDQPPPSVAIAVTADTMGGFNIHLKVRDFRFTPQRTGDRPVRNEGHAHLFINGRKVARLYGPDRHLPASLLRPGINRLRVTLNANNHAIWALGKREIGQSVLVDATRKRGNAIVERRLTYRLVWRMNGLQRTESGWRVRNDRGFDVMVVGGSLVVRTLQLVPAAEPVPSPDQAAGLLRMILGISPAHAGHALLGPARSLIDKPIVEGLARLSTLMRVKRKVSTPDWQSGHILYARQPGEPGTTRTLKIQVRWRRGKGTWTPLSVETASPDGRVLPLLSPKGGAYKKLPLGNVTIDIERNAARLFDGIDFERMPADTIAAKVLGNIARTTRMVVRP